MSATPQDATCEIGIVLARRALDNPWIDHIWTPHALLAQAPDAAPGTLLSQEGNASLFYAGPATIELFVSETANYRDNLDAGEPRLWIAARSREDGGLPEFLRVSVDPTEGEAFFESGADIVGTVSMPAELSGWIAAFVDAFHVERVFLKRQRDRSERKEPGFGRGPQGGPKDGEKSS